MKTYITVHAVAVDDNNDYLVLQRADRRSSPGKWNHVTGYIKDRESAEEAALRELKEETNLTGRVIKTTEPFWVDGNNVRWVVITSLIKVKNPGEIKVDKKESQDYKWIDKNDPIIEGSRGLKASLIELGLLKGKY